MSYTFTTLASPVGELKLVLRMYDRGELADGARILEEELAAHYSVSRSPVREAIGLLERRGLVRTEPRRGTYVVGFTPDLIADLFNVRGVLTGLAARYVARQRDPQALADLQEVAQALAQANQQPDITPMQFAKIANGCRVNAHVLCCSCLLRFGRPVHPSSSQLVC